MPNAIVKNVLVSIFLVVLCIVIGAQASESKVTAVGIIVALAGICFMLWIGPRCWVLIYLLPPIMEFVPLPGKIGTLPISFLIGLGVFAYWIVMWGMGYVRFKWRGLLVLDLLVLLMFGYMVSSYIRHPVSMAVFGYDAEFIGGKEYVWCILATIFYIAISAIPCSYQQFQSVTRWGVRLMVGFAILSIFLSLAGIRGGTNITELHDAATTTRFSMFVAIGTYGLFWFYGMHPMSRVLTTPSFFIGTIVSFLAVLVSGWREVLMGRSFILLTLAIIKREFWCFCLIIACGYGVLVYLSSEGVVEKFPFGMQRCLTVFPGVKVSRDAELDASGSSEWRIVMWKWALDPRTKYIKDYVWGDGFGQSVDGLRRETIALSRGTAVFGTQEFFAETGTWHNGAILAVHRLGMVGLSIITAIYLYVYILLIRTCMQLRGTPLFLPALFFALPYAAEPSLYYISAGTIINFFTTYDMIAIIKIFYCIGREQGIIVPLLQRQRYVPLAIRAHGEQLQP